MEVDGLDYEARFLDGMTDLDAVYRKHDSMLRYSSLYGHNSTRTWVSAGFAMTMKDCSPMHQLTYELQVRRDQVALHIRPLLPSFTCCNF
jgi:hypothetical protein